MKTFSEVDLGLQQVILRKVIELSWDDFGYKKIIQKIAEDFSVKLGKGLLSYWFNNDVKLFGGQNKFEIKPSKELAYVIGVIFGDGNLFHHKSKSDYLIRLDAIDKDFVETFSSCVSKVLNKERNYVVMPTTRKSMDSIMYSTRARSKQLYYFLKELKADFEKVKPFAQAYPKEFIQGLADSEGCPSIAARNSFQVGVCVAYSMNIELLAFVCLLLKMKFTIKSKVRLARKKGVTDSVINGRPITRKNNVYFLSIGDFQSTQKFAEKINFGIERKRQKLNDAVDIFENYCCYARLNEWHNRYFKPKSKWVPKAEINFDN
jgi:DNA endonuclease